MSDPYRQTCRVLRYATWFVMAGLGLLVVSGVAGLPLWPPGSVTRFEGSQRLLLTAILALPSLGYLWALWSAQRALGAPFSAQIDAGGDGCVDSCE